MQGMLRMHIPFIEDNFLIMPHTARMASHYLNNVGIQVLDWLPKSPDLNPKELLWDKLGRKLRQNYEELHVMVLLEHC